MESLFLGEDQYTEYESNIIRVKEKIIFVQENVLEKRSDEIMAQKEGHLYYKKKKPLLFFKNYVNYFY